MALTETKLLPLGFIAHEFTLFDVVSQEFKSLRELKGDKGTVVMFICNHCPYVKHINLKLVEVARNYIKKGISFIAINSNDVEQYPDDSPENMRKIALELSYPFPYLFDENQQVAIAYQAACTPDFNLFDADLKCVYRGRFCPSTPGNGIPVTGKDLINAMDALINNQPIDPTQFPSMGCSIKWKKQ